MRRFLLMQQQCQQFNWRLQRDSYQHSKSDVYGACYEDVGMMAHLLGPSLSLWDKRDKIFRTMFGLSSIIEVPTQYFWLHDPPTYFNVFVLMFGWYWDCNLKQIPKDSCLYLCKDLSRIIPSSEYHSLLTKWLNWPQRMKHYRLFKHV